MLVISRPAGSTVLIGNNIRISVRSIQRGSHVRLGIDAPRDVPIVREELLTPATKGDGGPAPPDRSRFRVAVVEDDAAHRRLIVSALHRVGVTDIVTEATGERAIADLGQAGEGASADLIMLDLQLPDLSGLDVLARLRSREELRRTPIVILSCQDSDASVARCLDAGASAFVVKDERLDRFRESVGRTVRFWQQARFVA